MLNIAVLVSGGGTNLQALIDAEKAGKIENGRISVVVASKPGVYALERAKNAGIEGVVLARKDFESGRIFFSSIWWRRMKREGMITAGCPRNICSG